MSKVKPLLPGPVAAARRVLRECDVRHPRDICVEVIAARYGALVVYGPLETARGSIVRTTDRALIWVDEAAKGEPRADFTGAHELGHHIQHEVVDHFAQCHGQREAREEAAQGEETARPRDPRDAREADRKTRAVEREANHFATELLMPEEWAAPICRVPQPGIEDVYRLSRTFRTSFHASALRFIELTKAPCAFVHTVGSRIKRSTETSAFSGAIIQRRAIHPQSLAARLQDAPAGTSQESANVSGAAWSDEGGRGFVEHAIALGPEVGVMSWVVGRG